MKNKPLVIVVAVCCLVLPVVAVLLGGGSLLGFAFSTTENGRPSEEAVIVGDPPKAVAGLVPQRITLLRGTKPIIDGAYSYDPDGGEIISYAWSVKRAPEAKQGFVGTIVSDGRSPSWEMWQPTEEDLGEWVFKLTVTDDEGMRAHDELVVVIQDRVDAILEPKKVAAEEATFLTPDDSIVGVTVNGKSIAYPAKVTFPHGLVNDTVGGTPLYVVFCEFCQSGVAWKRILNGQVFMMHTLGGTLFEDHYRIEDDVTGSTWHAVFGEVPEGAYAGTTLEEVPAQLTTWGEWFTEHPDTLVLAG